MMARTRAAHLHPCPSVAAELIEIVQDGTVLMGRPSSLAHSFNVSVHELRAALRELLERGQIAVGAEAHGQITVRLERRQATVLPPLPPALERRSTQQDIWIF